MTLYSLLCQLMMHNSLLEQSMTIFTNTLKNIDVYSGQSHFYTSILCVHQMVECWQGVHSYKKNLPPMQTECITEGLWIAICTGSSLSVPSHWLTLQPQAHFLSFSALLCTWRLSAADCITWTLLPLGLWLGWASERHQQETREWAERSDGISCSLPVFLWCFWLYPATTIVFTAFWLHWFWLLPLLPWKYNSFHQLPLSGSLSIFTHHSAGNPFI